MSLAHHHDHHHHPTHQKAFALGILFNLLFIAIEIVYGLLAHSLALIADAGHNLSDVLSLLLAWGAGVLANRKPTLKRTYGFRRATILASLVSATLLLVALGAIAWEAIERLRAPTPVHGDMVMLIAGIGVIINTLTALLFFSGRNHDLNVKAAFLHMAADAAVSFGIVISGLAIMLTGWLWLDPATSLIVVTVILIASLGLLRDSLNLAIDAVPKDIDPYQVIEFLKNQHGVSNVHDFHIWGMSTTHAALTVHLVIPGAPRDDRFLANLAHQLHHQFGIEHSTIQIERGDSSQTCTSGSCHCI